MTKLMASLSASVQQSDECLIRSLWLRSLGGASLLVYGGRLA